MGGCRPYGLPSSLNWRLNMLSKFTTMGGHTPYGPPSSLNFGLNVYTTIKCTLQRNPKMILQVTLFLLVLGEGRHALVHIRPSKDLNPRIT